MDHEETRRFARRMLAPIVAEFKREVAQQRANGASEVDIQEMLAGLNPSTALSWMPISSRTSWSCLGKLRRRHQRQGNRRRRKSSTRV